MVKRKSVPTDTQRELWAESMGHCMNPACQCELLLESSIADIAHIKPHAKGGDVTAKNLILLCRNCHSQIDNNRNDHTIGTMTTWKKNRNREIRSKFTKKCESFQELEDIVVPILGRNKLIFDSYGPDHSGADTSGRRNLWKKFEGEIIANNSRLEAILRNNRRFFNKENQKIIDNLIMHIAEFVNTRGEHSVERVKLFPRKVLSIFGLEESLVGLPSNLSALQNLLALLIKDDRFIDLQLTPKQTITYEDHNGKIVKLNLNDAPRVNQLYWSGYCYHPKTTELPLDRLDILFELVG